MNIRRDDALEIERIIIGKMFGIGSNINNETFNSQRAINELYKQSTTRK